MSRRGIRTQTLSEQTMIEHGEKPGCRHQIKESALRRQRSRQKFQRSKKTLEHQLQQTNRYLVSAEVGTSDKERDTRIVTTTRSGRKAKPPPRLIQVMAAEIADLTSNDIERGIFCFMAMFPDDDRIDYDDPMLAYKAVSDPDTLYYHLNYQMDSRSSLQFGR